MRFISAVLAACMMAALLPAAAFAEEESRDESGVSAQEAGTLLLGGEQINDENNSGTYCLNGTYGQPITVDTTGDVTINIAGDVTYKPSGSFITVRQAKKLTVNITNDIVYDGAYDEGSNDDPNIFLRVNQAEVLDVNSNGHKVHAVDAGYFLYAAQSFSGRATVTGGNYEWFGSCGVLFYISSGTWFLNDVTTACSTCSIFIKGGTCIVTGGAYGDHRRYGNDVLLCTGVGTELILNNVEVTAYNDNNTALSVRQGAKAVINGGTYQGGIYVTYYKPFYPVPGSSGSDALKENSCILEINGDAEVTAKSQPAVHLEYYSKAYLNGGSYTNNSAGSYGALFVEGTDAILYVGKVTVSNPVGKAIGSTHMGQCAYRGQAIIDGATIRDSKTGIDVGFKSGDVVLKSATFLNNGCDINLWGYDAKMITIEDTFTGKATVSAMMIYDPIKEGHQITTAAPGTVYSPNMKLISLNEDEEGRKFLVAYNEDGGYYYLTRRQENKYTVTAVNASAAVETNGSEQKLTNYTQILKDKDVTLTAEVPEGKKFTGWKVEKDDGTTDTEVEIIPDENDPLKASFRMPEYDVTVTAECEEELIDPGAGAGGKIGGAVAAAIVGGAAAWGVYETGTGIYRMVNMKGIPLPTTRAELAKLIWERAGKPEPENAGLYADIAQDDTDLQKAAHWMVEQDLMEEKKENQFRPEGHVTKLRVCTTWEQAKQKGLIE